MPMSKFSKIHIIGCGQVGSVLSRYFIQGNYSVSVFESPYRKRISQHPWGWMRRVTLQQEARIRRPLKELDVSTKHKVEGPMIISTYSGERYSKWKTWLEKTKDTDARILGKEESVETYHRKEPYNLLCDSRDFLYDFGANRNDYVEDIKADADKFITKNITRLEWFNGKIICILDDEGTIYPIKENEKVILCVGNETRRFVNVPTVGVRLGYSIQEKFKRPRNIPYIASWSDTSSVQYFPDYTKVGCGMVGKLDYIPPIKYWPRFLPLWNKSNYYSFQTLREQVQRACKEVNVPYHETMGCTVDITPNFLPMILPMGENLVVVCGMSGSGFTVYEWWFQNLVEKVLFQPDVQHYFNGKNHVSIPTESYLY